MTAKQVRFVTNDEPFDNQNVAELAAFDATGKPVTITGGSAPTVDTLHGVTDTGRAVMKATNAAAARSAIGAGTPYALDAVADILDPQPAQTALAAANDAAADTSGDDTRRRLRDAIAHLNDLTKGTGK